MKPYRGKWITFEEGIFIHVMPETDKLPHSLDLSGDKRELATVDCPCKPKIEAGEQPMIIHNSFETAEYLNSIGL